MKPHRKPPAGKGHGLCIPDLVRSLAPTFVIPAKAGIQSGQTLPRWGIGDLVKCHRNPDSEAAFDKIWKPPAG